jgi:hypothetical protein
LPEPAAQAVVLDIDVASRSFRERLPPRLAARLVGMQPILTFVTVGERAQWTKLRHWGPRNLRCSAAGSPTSRSSPAARPSRLSGVVRQPRPSSAGGPARSTTPGLLACCLAYQPPLASFNLKDFKDFAEHDGLRVLEP